MEKWWGRSKRSSYLRKEARPTTFFWCEWTKPDMHRDAIKCVEKSWVLKVRNCSFNFISNTNRARVHHLNRIHVQFWLIPCELIRDLFNLLILYPYIVNATTKYFYPFMNICWRNIKCNSWKSWLKDRISFLMRFVRTPSLYPAVQANLKQEWIVRTMDNPVGVGLWLSDALISL